MPVVAEAAIHRPVHMWSGRALPVLSHARAVTMRREQVDRVGAAGSGAGDLLAGTNGFRRAGTHGFNEQSWKIEGTVLEILQQ